MNRILTAMTVTIMLASGCYYPYYGSYYDPHCYDPYLNPYHAHTGTYIDPTWDIQFKIDELRWDIQHQTDIMQEQMDQQRIDKQPGF